ncbi:hypothetical protein [Nocardioides sp. SR21]|uniref:hypothetical protein n=1 Tax=Nocardioides sp. SR21 TaxID=2919501 RepID=UPI001FAA76B0|nr:hypothetical protein [Nocardioides sp. SR21]
MTSQKPPYVVHTVEEKDVTVDWFFRRRFGPTFWVQLVLILVGWFFVVLPVVITTSALLHRDDDTGWWGYHEGFVMWEITMVFLAILLVVFVLGFLALHLLDRASSRRRAHLTTYDDERLAKRLEISADWYAEKFGPEALRLEQREVRIQPHADIETYELRGRFRTYGVD